MATLWLRALLELQKLDLRLRDLESRLKLLPREMNDMLAKRDALAASTKAAQDEVRRIELAIKNGESGIEALQKENLKLQQQSALVKNNKEYQAMLAAVEQNKHKIGDLEEKTLLLMDELDAARTRSVKVAGDNRAETAMLKSEFDELVAFSGEVKKEIAQLKERRPAMTKNINAEVLSRYTALLGGKNPTVPVVALDGESCGNCHLAITPQTINLLKRGDVGVCDNCQHFIYDAEACGIE